MSIEINKLTKELEFNARWIPDNEKNSVWFREYIDKVCEQLKSLTKLKGENI